jgi:cobalt/nickel transport system permease protein
LHHVVLERWSRGASPLHRLDARAKLASLLIFLVAVSTTAPASQAAFAGYAMLLGAALLATGLPVAGIVGRAALVLPFSATFALITWWVGEPMRALSLAEKSFLSGLAVLITMATTPLAQLMGALDAARVPRPLLLVIQFLYRYLFVISEQAQHMRWAARCRQGTSRQGAGRRGIARFHAAAGAVGVLFARSWERADGIYRAMLARGFTGRFPALAAARFGWRDAVFVCACGAASLAVRLGLGRFER